MKELYCKLDKYFEFEKSDSIFKSILKSLVLLVSGGFFGLSIKELTSSPQIINLWHIAIFIFGIIFFVYLESRRLIKEKKFPISILEHLNATEDLKILNEKYKRKSKIYEYIDLSIQSLNSNTCPVLGADPVSSLCNQDLNAGLRNVLNDLIVRPNYFLDIDQTKFSIGVIVKKILDRETLNSLEPFKEKTFIFRDDLQFEKYIPLEFSRIDSSDIVKFETHTAFMESYEFDKFVCKKIEVDSVVHTVICSPIPNVCESCPAEGVIFTFYKGNENCQRDIESVLLIFGRILSNWISKYNECISRGDKNKP